jgi:large conductance mechanosensitive channel
VLKGFRDFILRGNVVDMAVGVIIGAAFNSVVSSLVKYIFTPLIAVAVGNPKGNLNVGALAFKFRGQTFDISEVLNAAISFLIVAAVVYFCVVMPMHFFLKKLSTTPPPPPSKKTCPECLSEIPVAAQRCAQCGQPQPKEIPEPAEVTA